MHYYDLLIWRARQEESSPVSYLPKFEVNTSMSSVNNPAMAYFIENGKLYYTSTLGQSSASQVGTDTGWTQVNECIHRTSEEYTCYAYGICNGILQRINMDQTVTSLSKNADLITGYYIKYLAANNNEFFGLAQCDDGIYRLGAGATKINGKHDFVLLTGLLYNFNASYYDEALGVDADGVLYRIAYDGTLTQVATGITSVAGVYRNGLDKYKESATASLMSGWTEGSSYNPLAIINGSLYYKVSNVDPGTLIDDTGTWTAVYGFAASSYSGYGIRDGHVCGISKSGYTDSGNSGVDVGHNCCYIGTDGLVYNYNGQRLTTA